MGAVLEVYEERPVLRTEHVPRVWLAVQQLLGGAPVDNRFPQIPQRIGQKRPIRLGEIGSDVTARNVLLRSRNTIHEVRRRDIDLPQAGVKTPECVRVLGRREHSTNRFEVGPHRDCKAVTLEDAGLDPRIEYSNRAVSLGEPSRQFNFSLCAPYSISYGRDPGDDIARRQAHDKPVGVAKNDRVINRQV